MRVSSDLFRLDELLSPDERAIRDTVARFVDREVLPTIGRHFRHGTFPREVVPTLADPRDLFASVRAPGDAVACARHLEPVA